MSETLNKIAHERIYILWLNFHFVYVLWFVTKCHGRFNIKMT